LADRHRPQRLLRRPLTRLPRHRQLFLHLPLQRLLLRRCPLQLQPILSVDRPRQLLRPPLLLLIRLADRRLLQQRLLRQPRHLRPLIPLADQHRLLLPQLQLIPLADQLLRRLRRHLAKAMPGEANQL
jgi:hypothetical protein